MKIFIVSSARSGSTILGEILDKHKDVVQWYEPYFIWDYKIGPKGNDLRTQSDVTDIVVEYVRKEFNVFLKKSKKRVVVDKSPQNSYKIDFIYSIFPDAKFIHLTRDGRDVVHSVYRETINRRTAVKSQGLIFVLKEIYSALSRQYYWRNRLQAIVYEFKTMHRLGNYFNKNKSLNKQIGWGIRFPGWEKVHGKVSDVVFSAMQWTEAEKYIEQSLKKIPNSNILQVRYEDLVEEPEISLKAIYQFMGLDYSESMGFGSVLNKNKIGQFYKYFNLNQQSEALSVVSDTLDRLNYQ